MINRSFDAPQLAQAAILDGMSDGVIVLDTQKRIMHLNPAATALIGRTAAGAIGQPADQVLSQWPNLVECCYGDAETRTEVVAEDNEERYHYDVRVSSLHDQGGRHVGRLIIARNVTERTQTEQALRRSNQELRLLNQASRAFASTLNLDQVLQVILDEVRDILGVAATSIWLINPETDEVVCSLAAGPGADVVRGWALAPGEGLAGLVAHTGERLYVPDVQVDRRHFGGVDQQTGLGLRAILSVPLRARQDMIGVLQVGDTAVDRFSRPSDMTLVESLAATAAIAIENTRLFAEEERRATELARALAQQRDLDRLKSEFIQNVSHELRTPLAIAHGYAELLNNGELGQLQPEQQESVAIIARRVRTLIQMMNDMAAVLDAESQALQQVSVSPATMVSEILEAFESTAGQAGLTLSAEIAPDLPLILGNPAHLRQVVDNLLGNAAKFTPAGGAVTVRLRQHGDNIVLEVTDTGIGIPPDQVDRIFDRFYQVDGSMSRRYGGTGLGLSLVKEIVEAHAGAVSVESAPGKGSTFTVRLPHL